MKNFFLSIILFAFALSSCKKNESIIVQVNKDYSVEIPSFLTPVKDLHEFASCQYGNDEQEFYLIVINQSKEEIKQNGWTMNLEEYFNNIAAQPFGDNFKNGKISDPRNTSINHSPAMTAEITGTINNSEAYYKLAVIETEKDFNQILVWTRADKRSAHEGEMEKIIQSFKGI